MAGDRRVVRVVEAVLAGLELDLGTEEVAALVERCRQSVLEAWQGKLVTAGNLGNFTPEERAGLRRWIDSGIEAAEHEVAELREVKARLSGRRYVDERNIIF